MTVVKINEIGARRVLNGKAGMSFVVQAFTEATDGRAIAHVKDYRYACGSGRSYQIWSIGPDGYEVIT